MAQTHVVDIVENAFIPAVVAIAPGDTVVWLAYEGGHSVTADDGSSFDSAILHEGQFFDHVFTDPGYGLFGYHCKAMPGMKGQVKIL